MTFTALPLSTDLVVVSYKGIGNRMQHNGHKLLHEKIIIRYEEFFFFFTIRVAKHLNGCQERFWNLLETVEIHLDKVLSNLI